MRHTCRVCALLAGPLPPSWGSSSHVSYLDLSRNPLNASLPDAWLPLVYGASVIRLDNCSLNGTIPAGWYSPTFTYNSSLQLFSMQ